MSRVMRKTWVALLAGMLFQLGSCAAVVQDLALSAAWEFVWDNDTLLDFFGDDGPGLVTQ